MVHWNVQQNDAQPCSGVAGNNRIPSVLENVRKSMCCLEKYSKTAPSHAAKWQEKQIFWHAREFQKTCVWNVKQKSTQACNPVAANNKLCGMLATGPKINDLYSDYIQTMLSHTAKWRNAWKSMAGKQHTFQNAGKFRNMNICYDIYSKTAAVGAIPHIETWQGAFLCHRPLHRGQRTKNAEKNIGIRDF